MCQGDCHLSQLDLLGNPSSVSGEVSGDEDPEDEDSDNEDSDDEDESDDQDSKSMAEEDDDPDMDYIEVKQIGGKYMKLKAAKPALDTNNLQSAVQKDERFKENGKRGGARLAMVMW
jgi:hypothetical protein